MPSISQRMRKVQTKLLEIRIGPGAMILPKEVKRIHMKFPTTILGGHMGPKYEPQVTIAVLVLIHRVQKVLATRINTIKVPQSSRTNDHRPIECRPRFRVCDECPLRAFRRNSDLKLGYVKSCIH